MNRHNCAHEVEQEEIEQAERQAHENGLCNKVTCIYCIEAKEEAEKDYEYDQAQGYYIGDRWVRSR